MSAILQILNSVNPWSASYVQIFHTTKFIPMIKIIKATAINCTLLFKFTTAIRLCSFTFNRLNPAITPNTIINVSTKKSLLKFVYLIILIYINLIFTSKLYFKSPWPWEKYINLQIANSQVKYSLWCLHFKRHFKNFTII